MIVIAIHVVSLAPETALLLVVGSGVSASEARRLPDPSPAWVIPDEGDSCKSLTPFPPDGVIQRRAFIGAIFTAFLGTFRWRQYVAMLHCRVCRLLN